jgi:organic hydroperoxide reductase OsmC/OhrA
MPDITTSTENKSGFDADNAIGDFDLRIHAQGETGPSPNEILVANYASCFTFAFRAGAMRSDYDDLGRIETEAEADLDEDDDLESISFTMHVEAGLTDGEVSELLETAENICHVHAALKEDLYAEVTVNSDAF